jgi:methylated-DNA-[protein]-cysteine S-methyltransferase
LLGLAATSAASSGSGRSSGGAAKCRVLVAKAAREIEAYLKGKLRDFSVPLDMEVLGGRSAFDRKVWGALRRVPHGSVTTYGNLAAGIDRPGAARAVGSAVGRNPVAILIPCHRVVGTGGRLTGFSAGLAIKEVLLGIEGFRLSSARKREDRRVLTAGPSGARGPAARRPAGSSRAHRKLGRDGRTV